MDTPGDHGAGPPTDGPATDGPAQREALGLLAAVGWGGIAGAACAVLTVLVWLTPGGLGELSGSWGPTLLGWTALAALAGGGVGLVLGALAVGLLRLLLAVGAPMPTAIVTTLVLGLFLLAAAVRADGNVPELLGLVAPAVLVALPTMLVVGTRIERRAAQDPRLSRVDVARRRGRSAP